MTTDKMASRKRKYPELHEPETLQQLLKECGSDYAVARRIGCTHTAVLYARAELGIPPQHRPFFPELCNKTAFMALNPTERPLNAIAADLGCSYDAVLEACRRFGVPRPNSKELNPVLRHPDVLAHLMQRYHSDTHAVADIIGARYETVRDYVTNYRRKGYLI